MLKLKHQYSGHLKQRVDSLEKALMLEEIEGRRRRAREDVGCHHQLNGHEFEKALVFLPGESHGQRSLVGYSPRSCRVGHD